MKKIVAIVVTLLSLYICVINNWYIKEDVISTTYFSSLGQVSANLVSGDVLEQEFVLQEGDTGVGVLFATYGTEINAGIVDVEVQNEQGERVVQTRLQADSIRDNAYFNILFNKENIESLYNQKCTLKLIFSEIEGQTIAVYVAGDDELDCSYTVNGSVQPNDLVLNGLKTFTYGTYKDIRLYFVFAIIIAMLYVFTYRLEWKEVRVKERIRNCVDYIITNRRKALSAVLILVSSIVIAFVFEALFYINKGYINPYRVVMFIVVSIIVLVTIICRKYIWKYAHLYFLMVSLLLGTLAIVSIPPAHISWDEQIHYARTAYVSWGANGRISEADYAISALPSIHYYDQVLQKGHKEYQTGLFNTYDNSGINMIEMTGSVDVTTVPYFIASMILYIGRKLGFSVVVVYMLGKFANLICYSLFITLAIKNLNSRGKMIAAVLGLIPTSMFMAFCYSYDWWIISLVILGFSIFIGEIQKEGFISTKKLIHSIVVLIIGMLPKGVYFPILFPMMLLKKERYEESKKARCIVIIGMFIILATFMLPMLFAGPGSGDARGGTDVNAGGQIVFILTNLLVYAKILFEFLWTYLSPDNAFQYLSSMAYLGDIPYTTISLLMICIAAVVDNSNEIVFRRETPWLRSANLVGIFGAIVLVATALYISFTPVGLNTINGCQLRYILPVLFPFLFFTGENKIDISNDMKQRGFIFVTLAMTFVFVYGWYFAVISKY